MVATREDLKAAVGRVLGPQINVNLIEMGMVRDVSVSGDGEVDVAIAFPCMGCPAMTMLKEQVREQVARVHGVKKIKVRVDWAAKWDRSDMSERAKEYAQSHGYRI